MNKNILDELNILDLIKNKFNHVLIIEDDVCYSELIKLYSNNFSKKVSIFECVEKAEKFIQTNKDIDLIITDYFIKGRQFGSAITSKTSVPTILMSGDMEKIRSERDFDLDKISYFIEKPVHPKELYDAISYL